ncbi:MAG: SH3 domain-containing protein [Clostridia bacterium]|nr:SH3 domain-containing protein [Clostridia bacterium]
MTKKLFSKLFIGLCLLFTLVGSFAAPKLSSALELGHAFVIASRCNLYQEAKFDSDKVTVLDEEEQPVLITLKLNDTVTVNDTQDDFAFVTTEKGAQGWVYKFYLSQNTSPDIYPVFNGSVRKDTVIYDIDKNSTGELALAGSRVYLYEGYDKKSEYTAVQIALADSSLFTGYISTADIEPDGVSKMLIVAITIIAAAATIILSLVFIKKKRKKKEKKG